MIRRDTAVVRWVSISLAFFMMIIPMSEWFAALRPFILAMVIVFWILETPQKMHFGHVFLIGLVLDLASISILGEHALRLLIIAAIIHQVRNQFRFYPIWQQALFVMALLYVDLLVLSVLKLIQGLPQQAFEAWVSPTLAFLIWPWLYMLLDNWRLQSRSK
jgi:rod shape-determining protein MreD